MSKNKYERRQVSAKKIDTVMRQVLLGKQSGVRSENRRPSKTELDNRNRLDRSK